MLAREEAFISVCQISRAIMFCFSSKTQWQMFMLLYGCHVCVPPKGTNMAFTYKALYIWVTLLQIMHKWKTAETWFLARSFIYQLSIISQILDFIHCILVLITWLVETENTALNRLQIMVLSLVYMAWSNWEYIFPPG